MSQEMEATHKPGSRVPSRISLAFDSLVIVLIELNKAKRKWRKTTIMIKRTNLSLRVILGRGEKPKEPQSRVFKRL